MDKQVESGTNGTDRMAEMTWFEKGLKFKCTGCGKCCTGEPGYVFLSTPDVDNLSKHLALSPAEFGRKYTRLVNGQHVLLNRGNDCIFLKDKQCSVYEARPVQCKTFPWWVHLIETKEQWLEAGKQCEGINNPEAPVISALEIQTQCLTYLDNLIEQNFSL